MANPRWAESSVPRSLPERVAQLYYSHGLICATYPLSVIVFVVIIVLVCSYPLLSLPLPGNSPQHYSSFETNHSTTLELPRWIQAAPPSCYVQQIIMRTGVFPWTDDLKLTDAFRAPLAEVFPLLEAIQNYQDSNSSLTLGDVCLHIETTKSKKMRDVLPEYSCLILSPANLWQLDAHRYHDDTNLISTIYNYQNLQKGKISLAELLFGLSLKDTGIKRYPLRKRQRIVQFAITLVYTQYHKTYLNGLKERLMRLYPLHQSGDSVNSTEYHHHVYYPGEFDYKEFIPLIITYICLFFYIYFSVRKIELVHSKVGIALTAVLTVFTSLLMSAGLCFFFGLDFTASGRGREIFPYLVVVVGLENVLVLTKSVVSTPPHLDVKIRIAQGLMREGWSITKNLLTEVTILTMGLLTLVPPIQEFCIFAITGLLCDFFLQTFFFCTVLGIDIRRKERVEPSSQLFYHHYRYNPVRSGPISRSHSVPRLSYPTSPPKMPRRLQLVHFWARTRIVQRAFMLCMIVWIGGIMYSADILQKILPLDTESIGKTAASDEVVNRQASPLSGSGGRKTAILEMEAKLQAAEAAHQQSLKQVKGFDELVRLKPGEYQPLQKLSPHHWASIISLYNSSYLTGRYLTVLPAIQLARAVLPEQAVQHRNSLEKQSNFQWQSLAVALDPIDFNEGDYSESVPSVSSPALKSDLPLFPSSPMELFLTAVLCIISVLVLSYTFVVLYRVICSRNYAEWRASWMGNKEASDSSSQVVLEAVPLVLSGHSQPIECLTLAGHWLVSSCLSGQIKVWDSATGDLVVTISRHKLSKPEATHEDDLYKELDGVCSKVCHPSTVNPESKTKKLNIKPSWRTFGCTSEQSQPNERFGCYDLTSRDRSVSESEISDTVTRDVSESGVSVEGGEDASPIWCMDCQDNLIVVGCGSGQVEVWEASSGRQVCTLAGEGSGVTCVRLVGLHIVTAHLSGSLGCYSIDWAGRNRRNHVRTGSMDGSWSYTDTHYDADSVKCVCVANVRAHQQPVTVLDFDGSRAISGSQDHTLKVLSVVDQAVVLTLHGHFGPITSVFIDRVTPSTAASGSQDGLLCVWELHTGACMYSIQAHDGVITCLTYSASYIISLGSDDRLCVWERFQGHLLNTIQVVHTYCSSMVMLTHNLLITSRQGSLVVWDVCSGEPVRIVKLGHSDSCVFVHQIVLVHDTVACDYGNTLRIVRFPMVHDKID